jgi:hypothetical protein
MVFKMTTMTGREVPYFIANNKKEPESCVLSDATCFMASDSQGGILLHAFSACLHV